ncbi:beta-class carbonic anhydrase [Papillibacter cinnamivorans]|uniref:carbonic anhydrase n=1 Tax=Papillibacter cinnamivorans DSM 12816 TaxID=1122930 RepID=A0A1W2CUJ3_9FIRM|nr:carbonic anhydrase [Papillibacter cinnamivorans]SMC88881.1 carbonic anhydrase [Papillibacter cinnamivorans DSM 12816]
MLEEILRYNKSFVENREYRKFETDKYPHKKLAILSCMDTRLTELLPAALGLKNGDAKIIKNAGAVVSSPFGSVMRSLVVAIYELGVEEILVVGHLDCGMQHLDADRVLENMLRRGISKETLELVEYCGVNYHRWLEGFESVEASVKASVESIRNHPLIPKDVRVYGLVMDPVTGSVEQL